MAAILFVDDETAIRDMLGMVLKLSGHTPMEVADAESARTITTVCGAWKTFFSAYSSSNSSIQMSLSFAP